MQARVNRDDDDDARYLPMSMGYRNCYKRYMASLGYTNVRSTASGAFILGEREDGEALNSVDFVTFPTYFYKWKTCFPKLKVSKPVEDICAYCFAFANRHKYLANRAIRRGDDGSDEDDGDDNAVDATANADDGKEGTADSSVDVDVDLNAPAASWRKVDEERELMLLEAAIHIKMARAQRALYQAKVARAVQDATAKKDHSEKVYTFVVDYGQNMELPSYNSEQPGCTYYFSPLTVFNLGVVNHAHAYNDGRVSEHMHAHLYHEGVGKKGANNVASLIVKTLRQLNILREDSVGGELNIIFDNCSGQNKNNTVLKLAAWLMAMNYFKMVNFTFLIVGHTKNAADRLFNSLKTEYRLQNLFTFQDLLEALNRSPMVTVHPASPEDFLDYDKLMNYLYRPLAGIVKKNHIFSCMDSGSQMRLRQSNLEEHNELVFNLRKRTTSKLSRAEIAEISNSVLVTITNDGLNPYKAVEMFTKYRPNIPVQFQVDELYAEPSAEVWAKVKKEKIDRSEFRAQLKADKYVNDKERIERLAEYDGDEGKA